MNGEILKIIHVRTPNFKYEVYTLIKNCILNDPTTTIQSNNASDTKKRWNSLNKS